MVSRPSDSQTLCIFTEPLVMTQTWVELPDKGSPTRPASLLPTGALSVGIPRAARAASRAATAAATPSVLVALAAAAAAPSALRLHRSCHPGKQSSKHQAASTKLRFFHVALPCVDTIAEGTDARTLGKDRGRLHITQRCAEIGAAQGR